MNKSYTFLNTFLSVFISLIFMCATGYARKAPIKIGFVGDLSDVTLQYCRSAFLAAQMAVQELNADGGELIVESEPGRYTRFHMDLPVDNGWKL